MDTKVVKEIKRGDRTYQFILSPDSPVGECIDVVIEYWQWLCKVNDDALKAAQDVNKEEKQDAEPNAQG